MQAATTSPCRDCRIIGAGADKNNEICRTCQARIDYVNNIETAYPGAIRNVSPMIHEQKISMPQPPHRKTCTGCGRILPIGEFSKHPKSRDGYRNKCKQCNAAIISKAKTKKNVTQHRQPGSGPHLTVDFTGHDQLYDELVRSAERNFRSVNGHVMAAIDFLIFMES